MSKILAIELDADNRIRLPQEAITLLGGARTLFLYAHTDTGEVILSARPPTGTENRQILDELAELSRAVADDDYFAPVPDSFLNK